MRDRKKNGTAVWLCQCNCGKVGKIRGTILLRDKSKSCGCYAIDSVRKRMTTHGMGRARINIIWKGIRDRCGNENSHAYKWYGGRGIKCLWKSFEEFRDDMYESYLAHVAEFGEKNTTIDRINNNGNYEKSNCRWATYSEQIKNQRPRKLNKKT